MWQYTWNMSFELRHLRYFVAVAEELSFTRAAARLHIAQPPLSQQIRQFEDDLGVKLFDRTKHQVRLTEVGRAVLEEAQRTLVQAGRVAVAARRAAEGQTGSLTVAFSSSMPHTVLPRVLRAFRSRFPGVNLSLQERSTEEQIELLRSGSVDVGFLRLPVDDPEGRLVVQPILTERLILALPKGHRLAKRRAVAVKSLAKEPFVSLPRHAAPGLHEQIEAMCRRAGFRPIVSQEAQQIQAIIGLVSAGLGVAIVPASIQSLHRKQVVYRPIQGPPAITRMAVAYEAENASPAFRSFLRVVADELDSRKSRAVVVRSQKVNT